MHIVVLFCFFPPDTDTSNFLGVLTPHMLLGVTTSNQPSIVCRKTYYGFKKKNLNH